MKTTSTPNFVMGQVLGTLAFREGKKRVPAHDSEVMSKISGNEVGDKSTLQILKGWTYGWDLANMNEYVNL